MIIYASSDDVNASKKVPLKIINVYSIIQQFSATRLI